MNCGMWYFIIIAVIIVGFFTWTSINSRNKEKRKREDKPPFRSEEDLEEYNKPMKDQDYNPVDFDDAQ